MGPDGAAYFISGTFWMTFDTGADLVTSFDWTGCRVDVCEVLSAWTTLPGTCPLVHLSLLVTGLSDSGAAGLLLAGNVLLGDAIGGVLRGSKQEEVRVMSRVGDPESPKVVVTG